MKFRTQIKINGNIFFYPYSFKINERYELPQTIQAIIQYYKQKQCKIKFLFYVLSIFLNS